MKRELFLPDADATGALGAALARVLPARALVFLEGDLGAGKTTLVRGLLRALGHAGPVKSPTYTLLESYEAGGRRVHHFDLYRVAEPEELEFLGARECLGDEALVLVEWARRAGDWLGSPDLSVALEMAGAGRRAVLESGSGALLDAVVREFETLHEDPSLSH